MVDLSKLYKIVDLTTDNEHIEYRKKSIDKIISEVFNSANQILDIMTYLITNQTYNKKFQELRKKIFDILKNDDNMFDSPENNHLEIQISLIAAILTLIERNKDYSNLTAFCALIICASKSIKLFLDESHQTGLIPAFKLIEPEANKIVNEFNYQNRGKLTNKDFTNYEHKTLEIVFKLSNLPKTSEWTYVHKMHDLFLNQAIYVSKIIKELRSFVEENDLLWLLYTKTSKLKDCLFNEMNPTERIFFFALELYDSILYHPIAINRSYFKHILEIDDSKDKMTLDQLVKSIPDSLIKFCYEKLKSDEINLAKNHPAVFSLNWIMIRIYESEYKKNWKGEFKNQTNFNYSDPIYLIDLSIQYYWEISNLKLISNDYSIEKKEK